MGSNLIERAPVSAGRNDELILGRWSLDRAGGDLPRQAERVLGAASLLPAGAVILRRGQPDRAPAWPGVAVIRPLFSLLRGMLRPTRIAVTVIEPDTETRPRWLTSRCWVFSAVDWARRGPQILGALAGRPDVASGAVGELQSRAVFAAASGGAPLHASLNAGEHLLDHMVWAARLLNLVPPEDRPWLSMGIGMEEVSDVYDIQGFIGQPVQPRCMDLHATPERVGPVEMEAGGQIPEGHIFAWSNKCGDIGYASRTARARAYGRPDFVRAVDPAAYHSALSDLARQPFVLPETLFAWAGHPHGRAWCRAAAYASDTACLGLSNSILIAAASVGAGWEEEASALAGLLLPQRKRHHVMNLDCAVSRQAIDHALRALLNLPEGFDTPDLASAAMRLLKRRLQVEGDHAARAFLNSHYHASEQRQSVGEGSHSASTPQMLSEIFFG